MMLPVVFVFDSGGEKKREKKETRKRGKEFKRKITATHATRKRQRSQEYEKKRLKGGRKRMCKEEAPKPCPRARGRGRGEVDRNMSGATHHDRYC